MCCAGSEFQTSYYKAECELFLFSSQFQTNYKIAGSVKTCLNNSDEQQRNEQNLCNPFVFTHTR